MKKKQKGKAMPKPLKAILQIGIVFAAVALFSLLNHFVIKYEVSKASFNEDVESENPSVRKADEDIRMPVKALETSKPDTKDQLIEKKETEEKKNEKKKKRSDKKGKKDKKEKKEKEENKDKKKAEKVETVKINDSILADLLTPLPDGTTKVQLYAETLHSKLGPITYFNQSDYRWAKHKYGNGSFMYSSGCGPTIMAMVVNTFRPQSYMTPKEMSDFAYSKGCYVKNGGSTHDIVKKCCDEYEIPVKVIKADKQNIENALKEKKLLVALVGKGEFTTGGHFILITGMEKDGKLRIADSISLENTHKKWDADFIISQLKKSVSAGPLWEIG